MYLPGKHIPIVKDERLMKDQPDYIVILAWHYGKPIGKILRDQMGLKSKLVLPLPNVTVWEAEIPNGTKSSRQVSEPGHFDRVGSSICA